MKKHKKKCTGIHIPKSNCCKADVEVGGDETRYYLCRKCHKACDLYQCPECQPAEKEQVVGNVCVNPPCYAPNRAGRCGGRHKDNSSMGGSGGLFLGAAGPPTVIRADELFLGEHAKKGAGVTRGYDISYPPAKEPAEWEERFDDEFGIPQAYRPRDRRLSQLKHIFDANEAGEAVDDYIEQRAEADAYMWQDHYDRTKSFISNLLQEQEERVRNRCVALLEITFAVLPLPQDRGSLGVWANKIIEKVKKQILNSEP